VAYWYLVKTAKYQVMERVIHQNAAGETTSVEENQIVRTSALPPGTEQFYRWSAAYTSDESYALVRSEDVLPQPLYEKELVAPEDFEGVYSTFPELRARFADQP